MKNVLKIIIELVAFILVIGILYYARNLIVLNNLSKDVEQYAEATNYYIKRISYGKNNIEITNSYNKDGKYLTNIDYYIYDTKENLGKTLYFDGESDITILKRGNDVTVTTEKDVFGEVSIANVLKNKNLFSLAIQRIEKEEVNGEEYYYINIDGLNYFINKETGLITRLIKFDKDINQVIDYYYEFNQINDIEEPDISGYDITVD